MLCSFNLVLTKAHRARNLQADFAPKWLWPEKSLAQWDKDIRGLDKAARGVYKSNYKLFVAQRTRDMDLHALAEETLFSVSRARLEFGADPKFRKLLARLRVTGINSAAILEEAREWEALWQKLGPQWTPMHQRTLKAFKKLRRSTLISIRRRDQAFRTWRALLEDAYQAAARAAISVDAWIAAALAFFGRKSPEAALVRKLMLMTPIGHESSPSPVRVPPPPVMAMALAVTAPPRGASPSPPPPPAPTALAAAPRTVIPPKPSPSPSPTPV